MIAEDHTWVRKYGKWCEYVIVYEVENRIHI
jgi:hypothetical protein